MVANVYIDGFNLYYRALRAQGKRWLNLRDLCAASLPQEEIHRIRYFTPASQPGSPETTILSARTFTLRHLSRCRISTFTTATIFHPNPR